MAETTQSETPEQEAIRKKREAQFEKLNARDDRCALCDYTGVVMAEKPSEYGPLRYAFRCPRCEAPELKNLSQHIPLWTDQFGFKLLTFPARKTGGKKTRCPPNEQKQP